MLKNEKNLDANVEIADRRAHPRVAIRYVAYVDLDDDNGGLILNVSEGGIGVQSAEMIVGERFSRIRFRLPKSENWIEAAGKLVWLGKSRKEAGIQFLGLSADARQQIQTWIYSATFHPGLPIEQGHFKIVWESEETDFQAPETPLRESAEIASMFPSEKVLPPKRRSAVNVNLNGASPLALGIAPGPVKRPISPPDSTIPQQQPAISPGTPTPSVQSGPREPKEPGFRNRTSYNYPAVPGTPADPFASIAADRAEIPAAPAPPLFGSSPGGDTPTFALREHYRGLGYNPQPFEEPSGKGWYIAAAILLVLLAVGTVLAIGPANVKALLVQHIPSSIYSSLYSSNPAPPPPENATDKTPASANSIPSSSFSEDLPLGTAAERSIVNPGISDPPTPQQPGTSAPPNTTPANTPRTEAPVAAPPPEQRSQVREQETESQPPEEDAAEITRRFQMEHSYSGPTSNPPVTRSFSSSQTNSAASVAEDPVHTVQNDRTFDAYPEPAPASPPTVATAPALANAPSQVTPPPAGTVAVSSHFYSLRGEDPQTTLARQALAVGQLVSIHQPVYPVEAERARMEGTVQLRLTVDPTGKVEIVHAVGGPPILVPAAIEAVRQWRYAPTTVAGRAMESVDDVNVVFRLANSAASSR